MYSHLTVIAVVDHPRALATCGAVGLLECVVVKRPVRQLARATGRAFNHVDIRQAQRREHAHQMLKKRLWVFVRNVVGRGDRGDTYTHLAAANGIGHREHAFAHQTAAVFDAAAVIVGTVIGAGLEELIEQIAIGGMQLHTIKTG